MERETRLGGRVIELYIPFEFEGDVIKEISFGPWILDYTLRWNAGEFAAVLDVVAMLAGFEGDKRKVIRQLREVDNSRVMNAFFSMVPAEIRQDITDGNIPSQNKSNEEAPVEDTEFPDVILPPHLVEDDQPQEQAEASGIAFDLDDHSPVKAA